MKKKKKSIIIISSIIIAIILLFAFLITFSNLMFKKYIKDNNYFDGEYNIQTLLLDNITYQVLYDNNIISKNILTTEGQTTINTTFYYKKDSSIVVESQSMKNNNNTFDVSAKSLTYKNNKFQNCEILLGNDNDCTMLENDVLNFKSEVQKIFKDYNIIPIFLLF